MAYFNSDQNTVAEEDHQPVFQEPVEDDYYDEEDTGEYPPGAYYDDEYFDDEERREAKRVKWRLIANIGDFVGVLAGTVVILLLIALLVSLITWVQGDISQSFTLWQTKI